MDNGPETMSLKIARLPKWAQDYIRTLERNRAEAISEVDRVLNDQVKRLDHYSHTFYTDDNLSLGRESGCEHKKRYFLASSVSVELDNGIHLNINPINERGGQSGEIRLYFDLRRSKGEGFSNDVAIFPAASNSIVLRKINKVE